MATRDTTKSTTPGAFTGDDFLDEVAGNTKTLYDAAHFPLTSVGGTANAVTAVLDPDFDADGLVDGMLFSLTWGAANTGGVTLAINGGSAVPVLDAEGGALIAGALTSGLRTIIEYIGGDFRILTGLQASGGTGSATYALTVTSSMTWTKPAGLDDDQIVYVELWGGGGSGRRSTADNNSKGGGGGSYIMAAFRAGDLPASVSISIGAGGASVTANGNGINGGTTSFGALLSAPGGQGGTTANGVGGAKGSASSLARGVRAQTGGDGAADADNSGAGGGPAAISSTPGGNSLYGGDGGAGGTGASLPGAPGSIPAGGGGANGYGGSASSSGAGARGEARIWI